LCVEGSYAGSKAENVLKQSDMLLAVNKESITCFRDIENACQALEECGGSDGKLKITVFRQVSMYNDCLNWSERSIVIFLLEMNARIFYYVINVRK
jgi:hypothetical protein